MGRIEEMDERISDLPDEKTIESMHLLLMQKVHACQIETNGKRNKILIIGYVSLYLGIVLSFVLGGYLYFQNVPTIEEDTIRITIDLINKTTDVIM